MDKENDFIIHISMTVSHNNIKALISISVLQKLKLWNMDLNQSFIQAHNAMTFKETFS